MLFLPTGRPFENAPQGEFYRHLAEQAELHQLHGHELPLTPDEVRGLQIVLAGALLLDLAQAATRAISRRFSNGARLPQ